MTHYFSLFFLLFSIMTGCRHPENGNVQPAILGPLTKEWLMCRWRMPIQLHQLEGALKEWKAAWWSVPVLLYALFLLLYALFFTSDKDCSCCKYVLRTADLCTTFLCVTPSLGNSRVAAIAVWSAQTALFCYDYVTLYHYYITLCHYYSNYFSIIAVHNLIKKWIIALLQNKKWRFGLEFIAKIGGAALLGGISATIGLRGNPCSRLRDRQSRKGSLLQLRLLVGVRIDASMAACIGQK